LDTLYSLRVGSRSQHRVMTKLQEILSVHENLWLNIILLLP
jgi:hypothetical protein